MKQKPNTTIPKSFVVGPFIQELTDYIEASMDDQPEEPYLLTNKFSQLSGEIYPQLCRKYAPTGFQLALILHTLESIWLYGKHFTCWYNVQRGIYAKEVILDLFLNN